MLSFAPNFEQAGSYPITLTASDGTLTASLALNLVVEDVPAGQGGQAGDLTLNVDKVESPSLKGVMRVTGTVNSTGT